ncbi:MAG: hypothetical protein VB859_06955 [Planctomycetaceae bacterium]
MNDVLPPTIDRPRRPMSLPVFGALNIVLSLMLLCCGGLGLTSVVAPQAANPQQQQELEGLTPEQQKMVMELQVEGERLKKQPVVYSCDLASAAVFLVLALMFLVSGVGLLRVRSWGRTLAMLASAILIITSVTNLMVNYYLFLVPLQEKVAKLQQAAPAGAGPDLGTGLKQVGGLMICCSVVVLVLYPSVLLVVMMTRRVRLALRIDDHTSVDGEPVNPWSADEPFEGSA